MGLDLPGHGASRGFGGGSILDLADKVADLLERLQVPRPIPCGLSIDKPVLVVSAEDDRLTPPKYSDYIEKHIHGCQRVHIQDAGHLVPIEKPAALNQALKAFIASLSDRA